MNSLILKHFVFRAKVKGRLKLLGHGAALVELQCVHSIQFSSHKGLQFPQADSFQREITLLRDVL